MYIAMGRGKTSPDLNLTPLFYGFFAERSESSLRSAKNVKKNQQEVSDLNRDLGETNSGSGVKWAECSLIMGTISSIFIPDGSVGLWTIIQSAGE